MTTWLTCALGATNTGGGLAGILRASAYQSNNMKKLKRGHLTASHGSEWISEIVAVTLTFLRSCFLFFCCMLPVDVPGQHICRVPCVVSFQVLL